MLNPLNDSGSFDGFAKFIGVRTDSREKDNRHTRIAGSEIPAKCLSMFCHSDILIEKQKCRDLKKKLECNY